MACLKKRNGRYYAQYYIGTQQKRTSLGTDNYQLAKQKLANLEASLAGGGDNPLPTRTPIADVVTKYVRHIKTVKTPKSAQTDTYYLRDVFGPVCDALKINSRRPSPKAKKRPLKEGQDLRVRPHAIEKKYFEDITTADISTFIGAQVRSRGLAPKTANRYREILCRLFNWAMDEGGVRMPGDRNPVQKVGRYKEEASDIRFLTLEQIDQQLDALAGNPQIQTMVAMYIYAGLRREEALWLTKDDIDLEAGPCGMIRVRAKTINGESWQPKTRVNRAVPISKTLRAWLDSYAPRQSEADWYFPSPKGGHWDPDNFSQDLRKINEKAKLPWACLDFRHTFGSQLAQKGESLYKISKLMGNSPEICRRHYAALIPETLIDSVEFGPSQAAKPQPPDDDDDTKAMLQKLLREVDQLKNQSAPPRLRIAE